MNLPRWAAWRRQMPDLREIRPTALVILLAGLVLNLVLLFLVNKPQSGSVLARDRHVQALRDRLAVRRDEVADLESGRSWVEDQTRTVSVFLDEVLSGKAERMVAVQREIREIARRNGIDPKNIGYSDSAVQGTEDMVRFSASMPLDGGYGSLRSFIHDVENARNFLVVDGVELRKSKEGGIILSLMIEMSTIFRDPEYRKLEGLE